MLDSADSPKAAVVSPEKGNGFPEVDSFSSNWVVEALVT